MTNCSHGLNCEYRPLHYVINGLHYVVGKSHVDVEEHFGCYLEEECPIKHRSTCRETNERKQ
jgi:hypothetical protein